MDEQSHVDDDIIPLEPAAPEVTKSCPVCFVKMVPDSPVCHRCRYDERLGPTSSDEYERVTSENRYADTPSKRTCRVCNYDLSGLTTNICPECGHEIRSTSALSAAKKATAEEAAKPLADYVVPITLASIGLIGMTIAYLAALKDGELLALYLVRFAIRVPILYALFLLCSILWVGFDAPFRVMTARFFGIMPFIDLCGILAFAACAALAPLTIVNIVMPHRWAQVFVLFILLKQVVDVEFEDAGIVAMILMVVYTATSLLILREPWLL